ncbi:MAG: YjcQ family protein [Bacillota bacterium]
MLDKKEEILKEAYKKQKEIGGSGGILPGHQDVGLSQRAWNDTVIQLQKKGLIEGVKISHSGPNRPDNIKEVYQTKSTKVTEKGKEFIGEK